MSTLPSFSSMKLDTHIKDALQKAELTTAGDILRCSENYLQQYANLTLKQCRDVRKEAGKCIFTARFVTGAELREEIRLTTGCAILDTALGGGVSTNGIVEISGEGGCGKTQLCLQLSLTAQWPLNSSGLAAGVLYICTEDAFPSKRLQQLINAFPQPPQPSQEGCTWNYGDNIYIEHVPDVDSLKLCLKQRAPKLMAHRPLRLIIIDSIAGIFRTYLENGAINRALELRAVAKQLTKLSVKHHAAVICVNQVADVLGERQCSVPALGLCWANLMHTRLKLSRDSSGNRYIEALSSPHLPSGIKWPFQISSNGLFGT